jgi:hypothetical protein
MYCWAVVYAQTAANLEKIDHIICRLLIEKNAIFPPKVGDFFPPKVGENRRKL